MKIKNNRRAVIDLTYVSLGFFAIAIFIVILNIINIKPEHTLGFYAAVSSVTLAPLILMTLYYKCTAKTIVLEKDRVAEYRKDRKTKNLKQTKLIKYDKVIDIEVRKSQIIIYSARNPDYPYKHIEGMLATIFYLVKSKDFRKRWQEHTIRFANYNKGFEENEYPFLVELANRSGCQFYYKEDGK